MNASAALAAEAGRVGLLPMSPAPDPPQPPRPWLWPVVALGAGCVPARRGGAERGIGYAAGAAGSAKYEVVSGGDTGHAESVQVTFDPRQVSYAQILRIDAGT
jgi:hypothetical protein